MPTNGMDQQVGEKLMELLVDKTREGRLQWEKNQFAAAYWLALVSPPLGSVNISHKHHRGYTLTMFDAEDNLVDTIGVGESEELAALLEELYHLAEAQHQNRRASRASDYLESLRNMVSNL